MSEGAALIVGLGKVGFGIGEYSQIGNSHFSALQESRNYKIYGSDIVKPDTWRHEYIHPSNYREYFQKFNIVIDAASTIGREDRLIEIYKNLNPNLILAEKPVITASKIEKSFKDLLDIVHIVYPRRLFKSSAIVKDFIKSRSDRVNVDITYNNGVYNALSHFIDLLDMLNIDYFGPYYRIGPNVISNKRNVKIEKSNNARSVFDISLKVNNDKLEYKDFGRSIKINDGAKHKFTELEHRYIDLYKENNYRKLPVLRSEIVKTSTLKEIAELSNE